ncbi:MAG: ATP synthase F1 subunit delta [Gemmatimonadaceae bacterium]|nr:ATP synthase F1 subunit delta [Gemmatimonadaceae bacterium]
MREPTIARNYAETLLALAGKAGDLEGWGRMIGEVARLVTGDRTVRRFLENPKLSADAKCAVLRGALQDRMPRLFVRFLESVVQHRRQMLVPAIADEYRTLVDARLGRVAAEVTLARAPQPGEVEAIASALTRTTGRPVVPTVRVDPEILGGMIVRMGDQLRDGSVRRRLSMLRGSLLANASR